MDYRSNRSLSGLFAAVVLAVSSGRTRQIATTRGVAAPRRSVEMDTDMGKEDLVVMDFFDELWPCTSAVEDEGVA
ncbi:hypothetical protein [Halococcus saccharolyticus]|uniref:hypothetical protein n=1 Tax=Halococcus saccharolyticus TaxID=62319 RepID=UPI0012676354|nr:hypothetical protein [Halococcus saccharolyticus]